ncbi:Bacteroidetes-specific putative membrane protein [Sphingobacterium spiritivorum]|uniref:Bacteroidetes-specific putative membrane protein n=1 Tax=Sphingobacterium spiritivorum TaxID=258 RepID=A0A380CMK4_SPHSI|nr:PorP/SprF family type IX secretion system membrane protein [Sphingobacterium spiritivorum]SUJ24262.1 Bacteroidetes-specific putative membrane protein [Sphingobacterium spiritivorum]
MKLKYILSVSALLLFSNLSSGQQYIDPALSGSFGKVLNTSANVLLDKGEGDAMMVYRYQWAGLEGSPKSLWFSGNIGVGNAGIIMGINAKQFRIGVERNTEISASFTKRLQVSESEYLGLGVNLGYTHQQGDFNPLDPGDPAFQNVQYGTLLYGLSATLISPNRYYIGFSMPKAIFGAKDSQYVRQFGRDNTFYLSGGFIIPLNDGFQLRPNLLISYREVTGLLFDASAMFYVHPKIGIGAGYRQRGDLMGMAEFNLGKLRIGYSYQQNLKNKDLNRYITNSTHELGIAIRFGKDNFSIL